MNWFDNVSTDCDHHIPPARLVHGLWKKAAQTYRVAIDMSERRLVAAQVFERGLPQDLEDARLEHLADELGQHGILEDPHAWGLEPCSMLPDWATPSFSANQISELERIQDYLLGASDDTIDSVLALRDEFLSKIGVTDLHMHRTLLSHPYLRKNARTRLS